MANDNNIAAAAPMVSVNVLPDPSTKRGSQKFIKVMPKRYVSGTSPHYLTRKTADGASTAANQSQRADKSQRTDKSVRTDKSTKTNARGSGKGASGDNRNQIKRKDESGDTRSPIKRGRKTTSPQDASRGRRRQRSKSQSKSKQHHTDHESQRRSKSTTNRQRSKSATNRQQSQSAQPKRQRSQSAQPMIRFNLTSGGEPPSRKERRKDQGTVKSSKSMTSKSSRFKKDGSHDHNRTSMSDSKKEGHGGNKDKARLAFSIGSKKKEVGYHKGKAKKSSIVRKQQSKVSPSSVKHRRSIKKEYATVSLSSSSSSDPCGKQYSMNPLSGKDQKSSEGKAVKPKKQISGRNDAGSNTAKFRTRRSSRLDELGGRSRSPVKTQNAKVQEVTNCDDPMSKQKRSTSMPPGDALNRMRIKSYHEVQQHVDPQQLEQLFAALQVATIGNRPRGLPEEISIERESSTGGSSGGSSSSSSSKSSVEDVTHLHHGNKIQGMGEQEVMAESTKSNGDAVPKMKIKGGKDQHIKEETRKPVRDQRSLKQAHSVYSHRSLSMPPRDRHKRFTQIDAINGYAPIQRRSKSLPPIRRRPYKGTNKNNLAALPSTKLFTHKSMFGSNKNRSVATAPKYRATRASATSGNRKGSKKKLSDPPRTSKSAAKKQSIARSKSTRTKVKHQRPSRAPSRRASDNDEPARSRRSKSLPSTKARCKQVKVANDDKHRRTKQQRSKSVPPTRPTISTVTELPSAKLFTYHRSRSLSGTECNKLDAPVSAKNQVSNKKNHRPLPPSPSPSDHRVPVGKSNSALDGAKESLNRVNKTKVNAFAERKDSNGTASSKSHSNDASKESSKSRGRSSPGSNKTSSSSKGIIEAVKWKDSAAAKQDRADVMKILEKNWAASHRDAIEMSDGNSLDKKVSKKVSKDPDAGLKKKASVHAVRGEEDDNKKHGEFHGSNAIKQIPSSSGGSDVETIRRGKSLDKRAADGNDGTGGAKRNHNRSAKTSNTSLSEKLENKNRGITGSSSSRGRPKSAKSTPPSSRHRGRSLPQCKELTVIDNDSRSSGGCTSSRRCKSVPKSSQHQRRRSVSRDRSYLPPARLFHKSVRKGSTKDFTNKVMKSLSTTSYSVSKKQPIKTNAKDHGKKSSAVHHRNQASQSSRRTSQCQKSDQRIPSSKSVPSVGASIRNNLGSKLEKNATINVKSSKSSNISSKRSSASSARHDSKSLFGLKREDQSNKASNSGSKEEVASGKLSRSPSAKLSTKSYNAKHTGKKKDDDDSLKKKESTCSKNSFHDDRSTRRNRSQEEKKKEYGKIANKKSNGVRRSFHRVKSSMTPNKKRRPVRKRIGSEFHIRTYSRSSKDAQFLPSSHQSVAEAAQTRPWQVYANKAFGSNIMVKDVKVRLEAQPPSPPSSDSQSNCTYATKNTAISDSSSGYTTSNTSNSRSSSCKGSISIGLGSIGLGSSSSSSSDRGSIESAAKRKSKGDNGDNDGLMGLSEQVSKLLNISSTPRMHSHTNLSV